MKLPRHFIGWLLAWPLLWVTALAGPERQRVTLRATEEDGTPIPGAKAIVSFVMGSTDDAYRGLTDRGGAFVAEGRALIGTYLELSKDGYYPIRFDGTRSDRMPRGSKVEMSFVLRRVGNPIALRVLNLAVELPVENEWVGLDFERGALVAPYGKGQIADVRFKYAKEFKGWQLNEEQMKDIRRPERKYKEEDIRFHYGKWDGVLEISFPGEGEGLYEEKARFLKNGKMKMPALAPADGYQPAWRYTANTYSPSTVRTDVGFFLRTRVKRDAAGQIVSAHYAKVLEDFRFHPPSGGISFVYYFNPTPNDRNLEFDFRKNLFPPDFPRSNWGEP